MISRKLSNKIKELTRQFPAISLTGPRQSGKTTLVKRQFSSFDYVSLEDIDMREFARKDPRRFLNTYKKGLILDEIQKVPELFSYLQGYIDESRQMGRYILTGSQNFLLLENITQSLAGRVAVLHLLPLSMEELKQTKHISEKLNDILFSGMYPALYDRKIDISVWYSSYITTYLERDVRQIKQIGDIDSFQKFMRLCAGRSAQMLNLSELGNECGISHTTAKAWLSVLQASFIVFLLQPYYKNFNKRLTKQPKLYFNDTGLLCALLGIKDPSQLSHHYYRGAIFETFIVNEFIKYSYNRGINEYGFFWRDHRGNEIDYLIDYGNYLIPIEIKSGETLSSEYFKTLKNFCDTKGINAKNPALVYGGTSNQEREHADIYGWRDVEKIFPIIQKTIK